VGDFSSNGSMMTVKPFVYVEINVAKWDISTSDDKSEMSGISRVLIKHARRSAQNLKQHNLN
jgi:hypothetical protein